MKIKDFPRLFCVCDGAFSCNSGASQEHTGSLEVPPNLERLAKYAERDLSVFTHAECWEMGASADEGAYNLAEDGTEPADIATSAEGVGLILPGSALFILDQYY